MDDGESEEAREEEEQQEREVDAHVEVLTPLCCAEPSTSLRGVQGNAYTATPQVRACHLSFEGLETCWGLR